MNISDELECLKLADPIFKDIKFYVTGEVHEKVLELLKEGGAERMNYFTDYVTHLICGNNSEENDLSDANDLYEIPALTSKWVIMSAKLKKLVNTKPYLYNSNKLFSNCIFCFSKINEDRNSLWAIITYYGGTVQLNLDKKCTHLITTCTDSAKYTKAMELGPDVIKVATPDWILESVKNNAFAQIDLFHPKLINWPKVIKYESTTTITGFEPPPTESEENLPESSMTDSTTQALLDKLKQRMPWNQPQTTTTSNDIVPPNVVAPSNTKIPHTPPTTTTTPSSPVNQQNLPQSQRLFSPTSQHLIQNSQQISTAFPTSGPVQQGLMTSNHQVPKSIVHHIPQGSIIGQPRPQLDIHLQQQNQFSKPNQQVIQSVSQAQANQLIQNRLISQQQLQQRQHLLGQIGQINKLNQLSQLSQQNQFNQQLLQRNQARQIAQPPVRQLAGDQPNIQIAQPQPSPNVAISQQQISQNQQNLIQRMHLNQLTKNSVSMQQLNQQIQQHFANRQQSLGISQLNPNSQMQHLNLSQQITGSSQNQLSQAHQQQQQLHQGQTSSFTNVPQSPQQMNQTVLSPQNQQNLNIQQNKLIQSQFGQQNLPGQLQASQGQQQILTSQQQIIQLRQKQFAQNQQFSDAVQRPLSTFSPQQNQLTQSQQPQSQLIQNQQQTQLIQNQQNQLIPNQQQNQLIQNQQQNQLIRDQQQNQIIQQNQLVQSQQQNQLLQSQQQTQILQNQQQGQLLQNQPQNQLLQNQQPTQVIQSQQSQLIQSQAQSQIIQNQQQLTQSQQAFVQNQQFNQNQQQTLIPQSPQPTQNLIPHSPQASQFTQNQQTQFIQQSPSQSQISQIQQQRFVQNQKQSEFLQSSPSSQFIQNQQQNQLIQTTSSQIGNQQIINQQILSQQQNINQQQQILINQQQNQVQSTIQQQTFTQQNSESSRFNQSILQSNGLTHTSISSQVSQQITQQNQPTVTTQISQQNIPNQISPQLNPQNLTSSINQQALSNQMNQQNLPSQLNSQNLPNQLNQQTLPNQLNQQMNQQNLPNQLNQQSLPNQINQQNLPNQLVQQSIQSQLNQQSIPSQQLTQQNVPAQLQGQLSQGNLPGQQRPIGQHLWQQVGIRHAAGVIHQQQAGPRVQWSTNQQTSVVPQRHYIQLDAQTHQQLQQMAPEQRTLFIAKLQKQRQLVLQQRQQQLQMQQQQRHVLIRSGPVPQGLTPQQQMQWLQQQAKQQGVVLQQASIQQPSAVANLAQANSVQQNIQQAPGLSPIQQNTQFSEQAQQIQLQRQQQFRLQQLQVREQAPKAAQPVQQPEAPVPQTNIVRPIAHPQPTENVPVTVADANVAQQQLVVNAKTKTALANMLSIRLQSGGATVGPGPETIAEPPSAAGTLRLMTAQHNAALNSSARPQDILGLPQRRPLAAPNSEIARPVAAPSAPPPVTGEPPKLQYSQRNNIPLQHRPGPFYGHNPNLKLPPDLFLLGCIFVVVELERFLDESFPDWQQKIEKFGGEVEKQYCSRVTHVLCETQRHGVVMQALRDYKRCVTLYWLSDIMKRKQVLPPWTALHLPTMYLDTAPASKHLISLSGFTGSERNRIKHMIKYIGATFTSYFSKHNTLLIAAKAEGPKYLHAKKWGTPIVNIQWLTDVMLGQFSALNQIEHIKYQQFPNPPVYTFDPSLVPNLMQAWKMPINISQESYERVKRCASPVTMPKKVKKLKTENTNNENENPDESSNPNATHRILFSMCQNLDELKRMVKNLGGAVAKTPTECTHLVMPQLSRTNKLLHCICLGNVHILPETWLRDSHSAEKFLDEMNYCFDAKEFNSEYKCDFNQTLMTKNRNKLLEGKFFFITPSVYPSRKVLTELIQSCGGVVERIRRTNSQIEATNLSSPYSYIILTHENDLHLVYDVLRNKKDKVRIVCNVELILSAILRQTFEVEPYTVKVL